MFPVCVELHKSSCSAVLHVWKKPVVVVWTTEIYCSRGAQNSAEPPAVTTDNGTLETVRTLYPFQGRVWETSRVHFPTEANKETKTTWDTSWDGWMGLNSYVAHRRGNDRVWMGVLVLLAVIIVPWFTLKRTAKSIIHTENHWRKRRVGVMTAWSIRIQFRGYSRSLC